ncbi:hypothetical protein LVJ94_51555 [Pendulispora rubella]|uniref:Uncharacterized protein n=1 Tax=Pendulispora rubella TaxID=2741070 RepID=A0ABZ2L5V2_9BACT
MRGESRAWRAILRYERKAYFPLSNIRPSTSPWLGRTRSTPEGRTETQYGSFVGEERIRRLRRMPGSVLSLDLLQNKSARLRKQRRFRHSRSVDFESTHIEINHFGERDPMNDLFERALALAFDHLASGEEMLPFVLIVGQRGATECIAIVTDRGDKAAYLGRRLVRERAEGALGYAIVTDAYVRRGRQRLDAIVVEASKRGKDSASVLAQPYEIIGGAAQRLGESLHFGSRPSELDAWDPHSLDWGPITPDMYVKEQALAVHAVNHNLESDENFERTLRFLRARIRHHAPHLPHGSSQLVYYNDHGQLLTVDKRLALRARLGENVQVRFTSEGTRGCPTT